MPDLSEIVPSTINVIGTAAGGSWRATYALSGASWADEPAPSPPALRVIAFSQRDPRWASVHLGGSAYTMGGAGCAVTASASVATQVNPDMTPLQLVTWLNGNGGFTSGGLLYWSKVGEAVDGLRYVNYHLWRKEPADIVRLADALGRCAQVVQVDFKPATVALETHFVVALSMTEGGADVNIIDPWTGGRGTLLGLYGTAGWDLKRAVYAMAEFALE